MERFTVEDHFAASIDEFERLLSAPDLYDRLRAAIPSLKAIELLEREVDDHEVRSRVRYTPHSEGKIPAFARPFLKPSMLSWIEEATYDRRGHRFHYRILPNLPPSWRDRFHSQGSYQLTPAEGGTHRRIDGEIHVRVPLVGGGVERMLRKEVEQNFRAEAAAIRSWLEERRRSAL